MRREKPRRRKQNDAERNRALLILAGGVLHFVAAIVSWLTPR